MRNIWNNRLPWIMAFPRIIAPFSCKNRNNCPWLLFEEIRYIYTWQIQIGTSLKSFCEEASTTPSILVLAWPWHKVFCYSPPGQVLCWPWPKAFLAWCLENADLENLDSGPEKKPDPLGVLKTQTWKRKQIFTACLLGIGSRHLVYLVYYFAKYNNLISS